MQILSSNDNYNSCATNFGACGRAGYSKPGATHDSCPSPPVVGATALPHPSPVVGQLVEMGFSLDSIETALSTLGSESSVEVLVVWLLEHAPLHSLRQLEPNATGDLFLNKMAEFTHNKQELQRKHGSISCNIAEKN